MSADAAEVRQRLEGVYLQGFREAVAGCRRSDRRDERSTYMRGFEAGAVVLILAEVVARQIAEAVTS